MPNRILRDGINDSEKINALSDRAELFYRRLMSLADDFGRAPRSAALLRAKLFPLKLTTWSEQDILDALNECDEQELILSYEVDGKYFLEIQNFGQRVRPNVVSRFPAPGDASRRFAAECGEKPPLAARASAPTPTPPTPSHTSPNAKVREFRRVEIPSEPSLWQSAGFDGPEAGEAWFNELVAKHPNRNQNRAARWSWLELVQQGLFDRTAFERWYEEQVPIWAEWARRNVQATNLRDVFADTPWRFPAVELLDDGLSPTMRKVLAMEDAR